MLEVDRILDIFGPLAGALIGGLITYLATRAIEAQRWRREKEKSLAQAKREAIGKALAWLDPMERALSSANSQVSALLQLSLDDDDFFVRFPKLISDLAKMDLPAELRLLLPPGVYAEGQRIACAFDEVRNEAIRWGQRAKLERKPMLGFRECFERLDAIEKEIENLRGKLSGAYLATFE